MEGTDPQFWVVQEGIGKGQLCSAVAQSSVTKEVSRIENKSVFWEVKVGAGEAQPEDNMGLLERPGEMWTALPPGPGDSRVWDGERLCPGHISFSLLSLCSLICEVPNVTPVSLGPRKTEIRL